MGINSGFKGLNLFRYEGGGGLKTIVLERDIHTRTNRGKNSAESYVTPGGDEGQNRFA